MYCMQYVGMYIRIVNRKTKVQRLNLETTQVREKKNCNNDINEEWFKKEMLFCCIYAVSQVLDYRFFFSITLCRPFINISRNTVPTCFDACAHASKKIRFEVLAYSKRAKTISSS